MPRIGFPCFIICEKLKSHNFTLIGDKEEDEEELVEEDDNKEDVELSSNVSVPVLFGPSGLINSTFSGLISKCKTFFECKNSIAFSIW